MSGTLTVRNLTTSALIVEVIERYDAGRAKDLPSAEGKTATSTSTSASLTSWGRLRSAPSHDELGEKARNYLREGVNIPVQPTTTYTISHEVTHRRPGQLLRLTLQLDSGKWRTSVPSPSSAPLQKLTPLFPTPSKRYTAVYLTASSTLAVIEDDSPLSWMENFLDATSLAALSIPGTHNSPTCYKALPSVRCQAVMVKEQLENGVRFLDVRVQVTNPNDSKDDTLNLVHGAFPISLTGAKRFRSLVHDIHEFLRRNPSETVVLSLKREGTGNGTDEGLSTILKDHYAVDASQWYTEPRIPMLGEVRGKIVILRRFAIAERLKHEWQGRGWCIDAENWDYNSADCTHGDVRVQDFCEVLETQNIERKIEYCCDHFERAGQVICPIPGVTTDRQNPVPAGPLYLNYLTASNFWNRGCWPEKIAERLNPAMFSYLCEQHDVGDWLGGGDEAVRRVQGDGGLGIVVCDWVGKNGDWDLIKMILAMNAKLRLRQHNDKAAESTTL